MAHLVPNRKKKVKNASFCCFLWLSSQRVSLPLLTHVTTSHCLYLFHTKCIIHTIRILKGRYQLCYGMRFSRMAWTFWNNHTTVILSIVKHTKAFSYVLYTYIKQGNRSSSSSSSRTTRSAWINNKQKIIKFGLQEASFNGLHLPFFPFDEVKCLLILSTSRQNCH